MFEHVGGQACEAGERGEGGRGGQLALQAASRTGETRASGRRQVILHGTSETGGGILAMQAPLHAVRAQLTSSGRSAYRQPIPVLALDASGGVAVQAVGHGLAATHAQVVGGVQEVALRAGNADWRGDRRGGTRHAVQDVRLALLAEVGVGVEEVGQAAGQAD